jgi:hypothetical protein
VRPSPRRTSTVTLLGFIWRPYLPVGRTGKSTSSRTRTYNLFRAMVFKTTRYANSTMEAKVLSDGFEPPRPSLLVIYSHTSYHSSNSASRSNENNGGETSPYFRHFPLCSESVWILTRKAYLELSVLLYWRPKPDSNFQVERICFVK